MDKDEKIQDAENIEDTGDPSATDKLYRGCPDYLELFCKERGIL